VFAGERAASPADEILAPPPTYEAGGVTVNEKLGARVPVDAKFRTQDGTVTTLGEVLRGELPTILTFNYADCPMLCSLQLNGLTAALPGVTMPGPAPAGAERAGDVAFRIGEQFRIVTIGLEPNETVERLAKMRERYLAKLPEEQRAAARKGWTLLAAEAPGETAAIRRVADAVGFAYVFIKDRAEWAHPAALIFLSTSGAVTRYVYGIEFDPQMLRESIFKAGLAEPQTAVGFMNRCYHFDPGAKDNSRAGVMALRVAAAGFVVLFFGGFGFYLLRRGSLARARVRGRAPTSGRPDLS
jgi:protein SCO1/2